MPVTRENPGQELKARAAEMERNALKAVIDLVEVSRVHHRDAGTCAVIDIGMIWRMATPTTEDRQTQDGTPYKWSDYAHKVSSIILSCHRNAECIICVNDPYNAPYSTKDDERDLRVHGKAHIPHTYMKLSDAFPSAQAFKTLLSSNKRRLQKLLCDYLTDLAQRVDAEIIYPVGT